MLGIEEIRGANRDQAVADIIHAIQEVPGGAPGDLGADRAQRERPAIAGVVGRGDQAVPLVRSAAGIGEYELRAKASAAGSQLQGVAVAELARVALHRGQVQGRWALVARVTGPDVDDLWIHDRAQSRVAATGSLTMRTLSPVVGVWLFCAAAS